MSRGHRGEDWGHPSGLPPPFMHPSSSHVRGVPPPYPPGHAAAVYAPASSTNPHRPIATLPPPSRLQPPPESGGRWMYVDQKGVLQGPYPFEKIFCWWQEGWFSENTLVMNTLVHSKFISLAQALGRVPPPRAPPATPHHSDMPGRMVYPRRPKAPGEPPPPLHNQTPAGMQPPPTSHLPRYLPPPSAPPRKPSPPYHPPPLPTAALAPPPAPPMVAPPAPPPAPPKVPPPAPPQGTPQAPPPTLFVGTGPKRDTLMSSTDAPTVNKGSIPLAAGKVRRSRWGPPVTPNSASRPREEEGKPPSPPPTKTDSHDQVEDPSQVDQRIAQLAGDGGLPEGFGMGMGILGGFPLSEDVSMDEMEDMLMKVAPSSMSNHMGSGLIGAPRASSPLKADVMAEKGSLREAKTSSLSAATLAVGSRARWVGPNGWIIEGGSDGRGMPMPGARGGWRLRGADNGLTWRLSKDPSLHTQNDGAPARRVYHICTGGGPKGDALSSMDMPMDPRPPPPSSSPQRARSAARLPLPPFAGGPETAGPDPVVAYENPVLEYEPETLADGSSSPSWSAIPGREDLEDAATSQPLKPQQPLTPKAAAGQPSPLSPVSAVASAEKPHPAPPSGPPPPLAPDAGCWFYFDALGAKQGPAPLAMLRVRLERGELLEGISIVRQEDQCWRMLRLEQPPPPPLPPPPPPPPDGPAGNEEDVDDWFESMAEKVDQAPAPTVVVNPALRERLRAEVNGTMHIAIMKAVKRFIYASIEDALKKHLAAPPPKRADAPIVLPPGLVVPSVPQRAHAPTAPKLESGARSEPRQTAEYATTPVKRESGLDPGVDVKPPIIRKKRVREDHAPVPAHSGAGAPPPPKWLQEPHLAEPGAHAAHELPVEGSPRKRARAEDSGGEGRRLAGETVALDSATACSEQRAAVVGPLVARVKSKAKAISRRDVRDSVITDEHLANARFGMLPDKLLIGCLVWLQGDVIALVSASLTCRDWQAAARYVMSHIKRADLSSMGRRATMEALEECKLQIGSTSGGPQIICLRGCTSLKPSEVRKVLLQDLSPQQLATLKLDLRECPALMGLAQELKAQCDAGVASTDHLLAKQRRVFGAMSCTPPPARAPPAPRLEGAATPSAGRPAACKLVPKPGRMQQEEARAPAGRASKPAKEIAREQAAEAREMQRAMARIIQELWDEDLFKIFHEPVTDDIAPGYSATIRHPMDLSTMRSKASKGKYIGDETGLKQFHADAVLMFKNAMTFNDDQTLYFTEAKRLLHLVEKLLRELRADMRGLGRGVSHSGGSDVDSDPTEGVSGMRRSGSGSSKSVKADQASTDRPLKRKTLESVDGDSHTPETRAYELIEEYEPVGDVEEVRAIMQAHLPATPTVPAGEDPDSWLPVEYPNTPRKALHTEVLEMNVFGIDQATVANVVSVLAEVLDEAEQVKFLEGHLLPTMNKHYDELGLEDLRTKSLKYAASKLVENLAKTSDASNANIANGGGRQRRPPMVVAADRLRKAVSANPEMFRVYHKGRGVVCAQAGGIPKGDYLVDLLGEAYPPWRWCEKQDAIRAVAKAEGMPPEELSEFYNMMLERPKGDMHGFGMVWVDAMHKSNYSSRLCHSCTPNCNVQVRAVNGAYKLMMFTLRHVEEGEELTYDYNCTTDSAKESQGAICLCGTWCCRGSYLNLTGKAAPLLQEVMNTELQILPRHAMLLQACLTQPAETLSEKELSVMLTVAGFRPGKGLLAGLPSWALKYVALLLTFVQYERQKLPEVLYKWDQNQRAEKKMGILSSAPAHDMGKTVVNREYSLNDAQIWATGVVETRLQNIAITLSKLKYCLKGGSTSRDISQAAPPLRPYSMSEINQRIWLGTESLVRALLQVLKLHSEFGTGGGCTRPRLDQLEADVSDWDARIKQSEQMSPKREVAGMVSETLHQALFWLRDEMWSLTPTKGARHDAAADLLHLYACTKFFFTACEDNKQYFSFTSPEIPVRRSEINPAIGGGAGGDDIVQTVSKKYAKQYLYGQLIFWNKHNIADPSASLSQARRGTVSLPDIKCCYAKVPGDPLPREYTEVQRKQLLDHIAVNHSSWSPSWHWTFNTGSLYGSPFMDAAREKRGVSPDVLEWFQARSIRE